MHAMDMRQKLWDMETPLHRREASAVEDYEKVKRRIEREVFHEYDGEGEEGGTE